MGAWDARHVELLMEHVARTQCGLSREDLLVMTDGELALVLRGHFYLKGRERFAESYSARWRKWKREEAGKS